MAKNPIPTAVQLSLFEPPAGPPVGAPLATPEPLSADSTLETARWWYRIQLEKAGHPPNTVAAYTNDLAILQAQVGAKTLRRIDERDIGVFLDSAKRKSTRKRRLTSAREFFSYVINDRRVLTLDPTLAYFPERINLKTPVPLFEAERAKLYTAAEDDGPRSVLMVYLLLELGLNRTELISIRREHIDVSDEENPVVYVTYDDPRWRHKERRLRGDGRLSRALADADLPAGEPRLFAVRPQAINAWLHQLVRNAGLERTITPQTLRDTFGVEQAKQGRTEEELLSVLGLASDPRNLDSVRRYIKLAHPPAEVLREQS
jgi:integrase/recombinase XerD